MCAYSVLRNLNNVLAEPFSISDTGIWRLNIFLWLEGASQHSSMLYYMYNNEEMCLLRLLQGNTQVALHICEIGFNSYAHQ